VVTRLFAFWRETFRRLFCSEEGNQATAKLAFGFTRAYNEKIRSSEAAVLRSSGIFELARGRKPSDSEAGIWFHPSVQRENQRAAKLRRYEVAGFSSLQEEGNQALSYICAANVRRNNLRSRL